MSSRALKPCTRPHSTAWPHGTRTHTRHRRRTKEFRKFGGPIQLASNAMESLKNLDAELYGEIEARVIARHPSMTSSGSTLGPNYVLLTTQVEGALQEYRDTRLTRSAAVQVCLWYMVHAWYMHTVSHALGAPCRASSTLPLITPSSTTPCAGPLPLRERHYHPRLRHAVQAGLL